MIPYDSLLSSNEPCCIVFFGTSAALDFSVTTLLNWFHLSSGSAVNESIISNNRVWCGFSPGMWVAIVCNDALVSSGICGKESSAYIEFGSLMYIMRVLSSYQVLFMCFNWRIYSLSLK